MQDFEKLGAFYLGRVFNHKENKDTDDILLYDSKDLTTHAVCVGMTGSGKTGLCISLLEEAAIDGIPAIIIDPKGDMTNLALTFPDLLPENFQPWVNADEARKLNLSVDDFAAQQAESWKKGLASWGQDGERIRKFQNSVDLNIFTPGSSVGTPVSILASFEAPGSSVLDDPDALNDRVSNLVSSLLGLLSIDADPLKSREHILLSTIFTHFWKNNKNLDFGTIISSIQNPPFSKIGFFELEAFFPQKDRFEFAMTINNLLAAPSFQSWMTGEALDVDRMLFNKNGKPRVSIFYIAHLSDSERMFFVSLLLNQVIGWMRGQSGTTSLRALLYIDELFGYMPPLGNPPSKRPLLTLLKQARAFGLGIVVATQNPVDLDYKGLSNTGTWFIGRLQTDRDRERMLDGLINSESGIDKKSMETIISSLGKRKFLMHNVHESEPVVFSTRWALSYLAGPLTRNQLKGLAKPASLNTENEAQPISKPSIIGQTQQPLLPPSIKPYFMPIRSIKPENAVLTFRPCLFGNALIHYFDSAKGFDQKKNIRSLVSITDSVIPVNWETCLPVDIPEEELEKSINQHADFEPLPIAASDPKNYKTWENDLQDYIYRSQNLTLLKSAVFKMISRPDESERDFRIRLAQTAREQRDEMTQKLREKYAVKINSLENKIKTAQERLSREQEQSKQQKMQTAISVGTTILGAFLGRKAMSASTINKASTAMRSASRTFKEGSDVNRAEDNLEVLQQQLKELQDTFQLDVENLDAKYDALQESLEAMIVKPLKSNISVQFFNFVWAPYWVFPGGKQLLA